MLESKLIQRLASPEAQASNMKRVSTLVVKNFVKRFNDEYGSLLEEQKELLSKYIGSFADDGTEFNFYLNEELGRLKKTVAKGFDGDDVREDTATMEKLKAVEDILVEFAQKPLDREGMITVLKIQGLAKELGT